MKQDLDDLETALAAEDIDVSWYLLEPIDEIVPRGHSVPVVDNVGSAAVWRRLWR
jgi:hypothetical protein